MKTKKEKSFGNYIPDLPPVKGFMKYEPIYDVNEVIKLLNILLSNDVNSQIYSKQIKLLFNIIENDSLPLYNIKEKK